MAADRYKKNSQGLSFDDLVSNRSLNKQATDAKLRALTAKQFDALLPNSNTGNTNNKKSASFKAEFTREQYKSALKRAQQSNVRTARPHEGSK